MKNNSTIKKGIPVILLAMTTTIFLILTLYLSERLKEVKMTM